MKINNECVIIIVMKWNKIIKVMKIMMKKKNNEMNERNDNEIII